MTSCEKCWDDARGDPHRYAALLIERKDSPCSPEEQAGFMAKLCNWCGRRTIHDLTGKCTNPECEVVR